MLIVLPFDGPAGPCYRSRSLAGHTDIDQMKVYFENMHRLKLTGAPGATPHFS
jgi:hypothetical protein